MARLPKSTVFSTLDANSGYWQIGLDDDSSKLCTFNTPWGRYRFKRLPFGIKTSGDIFIQTMNDMFGDIPGVEVINYDLLIHGENHTQHDERLHQALEQARAVGLKLNRKKCHIGRSEVTYVGHVISSEGLKPNPERITTIMDMPTPQCKPDIQRFLGMCGYLQKCVPKLSEIAKPLRDLLTTKVEWHWEELHNEAYCKLKALITSAPVLKYYDVTKPVTLQVDASKSGLGAALLQDGHIVASGSKALDSTQSNYAVIEKELLAICFGCVKLHDYVYGKHITVQTDHKPLVAILSKPLHTLSARMQRMRMQLQNYDITAVYRPGKEMYIADALSRAHSIETTTDDLFDDDLEVAMLKVSTEKLQDIQEATQNDDSLMTVIRATLNGWPDNITNAAAEIRTLYTYHEELTYDNGILLKGDTIVVPRSLQKEMLQRIHESHLGIVKSKQLARDLLFWPGMTSQIEDTVAKCSTCQQSRKKQAPEPLISHQIPDQPFAKVATDLFEIKGRSYVVCVDYYSKYPDVTLLPDTTSLSTI